MRACENSVVILTINISMPQSDMKRIEAKVLQWISIGIPKDIYQFPLGFLVEFHRLSFEDKKRILRCPFV